MPITASSIIRRATNIIMDETSVRWPTPELVRWLNDAQRAIVSIRPDAINATVTTTLAAGTRQDLDNMGLMPLPLKLVGIQRNMADTSNKNAVTLVARHLLDAQQPSWHGMAPAVSIQHYMFDVRDPKTFYVYPPATVLAQLEINYSAYPNDIAEPAAGSTYADVVGNLTVPDIYDGPILDLLLYRAYLKDSEFAGNVQRAESHRAAAASALGSELVGTLSIQPQGKPGMAKAN